MTGTLKDDSLKLAALYEAGQGQQWRTYRVASAKLSKLFQTDITPSLISRALAVSRLPREILGLFDEAGLTNGNARALLKLVVTHGEETLIEKARSVKPSGKTSDQILTLLGRRDYASGGQRPLAIAAKYFAGAFPTQEAAAARIGISRSRLAQAIRIASSLPDDVVALFPEGNLSFTEAEQILKLIEVRGLRSVQLAAQTALQSSQRQSNRQLLNRLAGVDFQGVDVKVKRKPRRETAGVIVELHFSESGPVSASALDLMVEMLRAHFAR